MFSLSSTNVKYLVHQLFLTQAEIYLSWQQKQKPVFKKQCDRVDILIFYILFLWKDSFFKLSKNVQYSHAAEHQACKSFLKHSYLIELLFWIIQCFLTKSLLPVSQQNCSLQQKGSRSSTIIRDFCFCNSEEL